MDWLHNILTFKSIKSSSFLISILDLLIDVLLKSSCTLMGSIYKKLEIFRADGSNKFYNFLMTRFVAQNWGTV